MERECFEDEEIAALMNEHFVCVKVDREERPDVDAIYMEAVQAMTGQGGWPLNVFLTPEQVPFYAGTYFPPEPRHGHAELAAGARRPSRRRGSSSATRSARRARRWSRGCPAARALQARRASRPARTSSTPRSRALRAQFDAVHGGWGGAPKFPAASAIEFLLRRGEPRDGAADAALDGVGGINDQVGGGFARYAVDANWTVPHFEKMLYDNALLARAYLHGWQVSRRPDPAPHRRGDARLGRCAR